MNETMADVLAEMRNYSNESNDGYVTDYGVVLKDMARFADRIEEAWRRVTQKPYEEGCVE